MYIGQIVSIGDYPHIICGIYSTSIRVIYVGHTIYDGTTQCYIRHMTKAGYANVDIDEIDDEIKEAYKFIRDVFRWRCDLPHANIYNSCAYNARKLIPFINECIKSGTYPDTKHKSKFLPKVCVCYRNISKGMYKVKLPCDK